MRRKSWRMNRLILQPLHRFTYVTAHFSTLIFQRFTYITAHSTTIPLFHICHRHFTYVTWRAARDPVMIRKLKGSKERRRRLILVKLWDMLEGEFFFEKVREASTQWDKRKKFPSFHILYFKNGKFVMYWKIWSFYYTAMYYKTLNNVF